MQRERQFNKKHFLVSEKSVSDSEKELKRLIYDILPPQKIKEATFQILGIKEYQSAKSGFFAFAWRFVVVFILFVFLSTGYSPIKWLQKTILAQNEIKIRKIELFSYNCQSDSISENPQIGWWQADKLQGVPQLPGQTDIISFSDSNSAVYAGGKTSIMCENFDNPNLDENLIPENLIASSTEIASTSEINLDVNINELATTTPLEEPVDINEPDPETNSISTSSDQQTEIASTSEVATPSEIGPTPEITPQSEVAPETTQSEPDALVVDKTEDEQVTIEEPIEQGVQIIETENNPPAENIIEKSISKIWQPIKNAVINNFSKLKVAIFGAKTYAVAVAKADNQNIADLGVFQSAKVRLSLAMATKVEQEMGSYLESANDNPEPNFIIWYAISQSSLPQTSTTSEEASTTLTEEIVWQELGDLSSLPFSNFINGGYITFDAPNIASWEDARNLKIKIEGRIEDEAPFVAYFDSVWLEAYYQSQEDIEAYDQKIARWSKMLEFLSDRDTFRVNEKGELKFLFKKNNYSFWERAGDVLGFTDYWRDVNLKIFVEDMQGTTLNIPISTIFENNGEFTIKLPANNRAFKPGKYRIKFLIEDSSGEMSESIILEQGFSWGVLAINTNKSVYRSSETAYLQMAVLDDGGNTICDADIDLQITAPDGGVADLTTDNALILENGQCGPSNVIDKPDYYAYYGLAGEGEYEIKLTARTQNGTKIIYDKIEVADGKPLEIERIGPTRIYPKAEYDMKLKIKANVDYNGLITEIVPSGFKITNFQFINLNKATSAKAEIIDLGDEQQLIVSEPNLAKGDEVVIDYVFDAPDASPELFLLGPLQTDIFSETRQWQIASDAISMRAKTVQFLAGSYVSADGLTGQSSKTDQSFAAFDFNLAENNVSIKDAYVIFESQYEAYLSPSVIASSTLKFDSCQSSCNPNAYAGTSTVSAIDTTPLSYNETNSSNHARVIFDVTNEGQLSSYTGDGVGMRAQVGYRIDTNTVRNSIASARAILVLTYTYNRESPSVTNTVIYPLDSADSLEGTKSTSTVTNCVFNSSCPKFTYNMDLAEYNTTSGSTNLSQWFQTYQQTDLNVANDVNVSLKIGTNATSSAFILEASRSNQGNMPVNYFSNVAGYAENTAQTIQYRSAATAGTFYAIGGEVAETYTASSSATTSTRTVSFPYGVINNGTAASSSGMVNVYFPENGNATGTVKIKKAWIRVITNHNVSAANNFYLKTQVGSRASSSSKLYTYNSPANVAKPSFIIIHTIPAADYSELENANSVTAKRVWLDAWNAVAGQGGVSAELMITYTYTNETSGYLTSLNINGGQTKVNPLFANRSVTVATANTILPETIGFKTIMAGALLASYLNSDNDGGVGTVNTVDANLSTGAPACVNAHSMTLDSINGFNEYYKNITSVLGTSTNQAYNACYSNSGAGDADTGSAKMNGILIYTYKWDENLPTSTITSAAQRYDNSGLVDFSFIINDADHDNLTTKFEYATGTTCTDPMVKATVTADDASTTATYGDPKVDNYQSYQIGSSTGWIITTSGVNTVNSVWNSIADLPNGEASYCLKLTAYDSIYNQATSATTTIIVDNVTPTIPGPLSLSTKNATSVTLLLGATSTEGYFREYKIFYKIYDGGPVTEADMAFGSSTEQNFKYQLFGGATTTTIGGLTAGEKYSFALWVYDQIGHSASSSKIDITVNAYPLGSFNKLLMSQKTNGSGGVDISIEADDPNNDDNCRAKIEFATGTDCLFTNPGDPTLDSNSANIQFDYSSPEGVNINNADEYQVGNSAGWIITSPGSNTISFDWLSKNELPNVEGDYCLRLTISDGINNQATSATTTLSIDNIDPDVPGSLSVVDTTQNSITLAFGATSSDTHFFKYKIFYKEGTSGVTEENTERVDANLDDVLFKGAATTTINDLTANTNYVFNIWAYDDAGNKTSATETTYKTDATVKNMSLIFVNPINSNIAVADNLTKHDFRAIVTESNGWLNLNTVVLRLANSHSTVSPFDDLAFSWNQAANTFSEVGSDASSSASIASDSAADCSGSTCTLDFKIIINNKFTNSNTDYSAELYSTNDTAIVDHDVYNNFYKSRIVTIRQTHYRWRNDDGWE